MTAQPLKLSSVSQHHDDALAAWLRVLEPLLNLPEPERRAIVEELENHLRERTRDQMLAGVPEAEAVRAAIAELGDAGALARRFREAGRTPLRRIAMNVAVLGVAGAALVTSVVAIRGGDHPTRLAVYQPAAVARLEDPREQPPAIADVKFENVALADALKYLAEMSKLELRARWDRLENEGMPRGMEVNAEAKKADLAQVFAMLNEGRPGAELDFRIHDGQLEVAPRPYFDQREAELVSFDISDILAQNIKSEDVTRAITHMVTPDDWQDNGGAAGTMTVVGPRLFIKAPPRMWKKAAWMLEQLAPAAGAPRAGQESQQKVPILSDLPILAAQFRGTAPEHRDIEAVKVQLAAARSDAAWLKVQLGQPLTTFERDCLQGERAVKELKAGDPARTEAQARLDDLVQRIEALRQTEASLRERLETPSRTR